MAYKQLQASSEKSGDQAEAALFGYLAAKFDPVSGEPPRMVGEPAFGRDTASRNAAAMQISGLMILIFSLLVVVGASVLIVDSRRSERPATQRAKPVATMVVSTSAVGLLISSATLYLTYRPYWYMFQGAILSGGSSQTGDLGEFLTATKLLPGLSPRGCRDALLNSGSPSFLFYFWTSVILLGVIGLTLILLRQFRGRTGADGLQHSPHVP